MTDQNPNTPSFESIVSHPDLADLAALNDAEADVPPVGQGPMALTESHQIFQDLYGEPSVYARFLNNCPTHGIEHGFSTQAMTGQPQLYLISQIPEMIEWLQKTKADAEAAGWTPEQDEVEG